MKHHIFLKIVFCWKIAELLDLTRSGSSWSSSLNPHHIMFWNKTNTDSTEPGCTTSQKMMCILISNSLKYMSPARGEKKVAYKIRHLNPHHHTYHIPEARQHSPSFQIMNHFPNSALSPSSRFHFIFYFVLQKSAKICLRRIIEDKMTYFSISKGR